MPFSFKSIAMFKRTPLEVATGQLSQTPTFKSASCSVLVKPSKRLKSKRPLVHSHSENSFCDIDDDSEGVLVKKFDHAQATSQCSQTSSQSNHSKPFVRSGKLRFTNYHKADGASAISTNCKSPLSQTATITTTSNMPGVLQQLFSPKRGVAPQEQAIAPVLVDNSSPLTPPDPSNSISNSNTISDSPRSSVCESLISHSRRSRCKLTFFPIRGRAEPIRLMLTFASVPFEDVRLTEREWLEVKKASPSQQLPVFEFNGKSLYQPNTIARFLGSELGLCEKDNWHAAQLDSLVDAMNDVFGGLYLVLREKDEQKAIQLLKQVRQQSIKPKLQVYETFLAETGSGYFGSKSITWADFVLFCGFSGLEEWARVRLKSFPQINAFYSRMRALPAVRDWMEEHEHVPYSLVKPPGRGRRYTYSRNPYPVPGPKTSSTFGPMTRFTNMPVNNDNNNNNDSNATTSGARNRTWPN